MVTMEGFRIASQAQTDCRFFTGYKPCGKNEICSLQCPFKQTVTSRILIIHLEAMGAVLRTTSLARALRKKWPEAHITWITNVACAPLISHNPFVDRVLKNDHEGVLALSALEFDHTF